MDCHPGENRHESSRNQGDDEVNGVGDEPSTARVVKSLCAGGIDKAGIAFVSKHFSEVSGLNQQDLEGELACILR